jgi:hypothetical protein
MPASVPEHEWTTLETAWPPHISIKINHAVIDVRRQLQNGKDLPAELTQHIAIGTNCIDIGVAGTKKPPTGHYALAVELVETLSHSSIWAAVFQSGLIQPDETKEVIRSRLRGTVDDDSISMVEKNISIDLADPFSSAIFKVPARGAACTHLECFDLETWLNTRPAKSPSRCDNSCNPTSCRLHTPPEPSHPDKWKCPICFKDARPYSLRIDGFLLEVRKKLETDGKLQTKSMLVAEDGSWEAVIEEDDDDDSDDDVPGFPVLNPAAANRTRPVKVIELD